MQWRYGKQMQPMWLCILSGKQFEEKFENSFGELVFKVLFLLLKLENRVSISLSFLKSGGSVLNFLFVLSKSENSIWNFSVSSPKWWISFSFWRLRKEYPILFLFSKVNLFFFFKFLFLFSKLGKGFLDFPFT